MRISRGSWPWAGPTIPRSSSFLFAADHLDALLDEIFILTADGRASQSGFGKLLGDVHLELRFALAGDEADDLLHLFVGDERALRASGFGRAGRLIKHVAFA
jgi:hypothetical protein